MITNIQEQLERDEGRKSVPYLDTRGWATGGIGHNFGVQSLAEVPTQFLPQMTDAQIDGLFQADLHHVYDLLDHYIPWWNLDGSAGARTGVMLNLGFNMGVKKLAAFNQFLALMRAKDWNGAAADLERTPWHGEVGERGPRICTQIRTGIWQ